MRKRLPDNISGNILTIYLYLLWMKKADYKTSFLRKYLAVIIPAVMVLAVSIGLSCNESSGPGKAYRAVPENLADGWEVTTLEDQRIDGGRISQLLDKIDKREYRNIHSLVIVKNGYLVLDEYFNGYDYDDLHSCYSMTKSVSSAVIGMVIDQGLLDSVGVCMREYFQDYQDIDWSDGKDRITLRDMLTMTSGLEWEELQISYSNPLNSHTQMTHSEDWIEFVLRRPMEHTPGTAFEYDSGTSHMLGAIIRETTGMPIDSFAREYLFGPLGIIDSYWYRDPRGNPCTGGSRGGVMLRPRDMAKFGLLYLDHGEWNTTQLVSPEWVDASITRYVNVNFVGSSGYGYQWWIAVFDYDGMKIEVPYAMGYGGQYIFVIEDLDMVVVFTGGGGGNEYAYTQVFEIMIEYILPAAEQ